MDLVSPDFSEVAPTLERGIPKQMLTVSYVNGVTEVRVNSSSLGIILACLRKSYYVLKRGLKSRTESPALLFGTAIHKAMEVFYSHPRAARDIPGDFKALSDLMAFASAEERAERAAKHFLYAATDAFITAAAPLQRLPDTDKRSIPNGIWILQEYFKSYINDPYIVYSDANGPVTERTCETAIFDDGKLRIILFGTIDVVLRHEFNGEILPADHKTSSIIGSDFFNRLKPNHQYSGYVLLTQRELKLNTGEFLVNCLQVKERPKTARGSGPHFTRQITRRSPEDLQEFIDSVEYAVRAFLACDTRGIWPLGHVNECTTYGGCQFLEVCGAPEMLRENLLESKFIPEGGTVEA